MTITVGSLCTGVAGLDLGIGMAYGGNTRLAWYAEVNPDACTVLRVRLPGVPNLGDLTAVDWTRVPRVDVLSAGFPCQPVSAAGRQKGEDDERWLWPHVRDCYRALRPQELVFENVRNLVSIRKGELFAQICGDLRADGYAVRWATAGACAIGGCHHRHRVFIVARYAWQLQAPPAQQIKIVECGARKGRARLLLPAAAASTVGGPAEDGLWQAHLLLPTPTTSDGMGGPGCPGRDGGDNLRTVAAQLPDPRLPDVSAMLPTPTARDYRTGYDHDRGGERALLLNDVAQQELLPTPRATDTGTPGSPNQHGSRPGDLMLPCAVIGARYGRYAPAVALWAYLSGTDAPEPTVLNPKGQWRLNPELPEWMMGYPPGWITDLVGRSAALRGAGNGVVPQVVAAVYPLITAGWRYLRGGEVCPDPIGGPPATPGPARPAPQAGHRPRRAAARPEQLTAC